MDTVVDVHFTDNVSMEDTDHEVEYRKIIYEKTYNTNKCFNETIEILKHKSDDDSTKNNQSYYILKTLWGSSLWWYWKIIIIIVNIQYMYYLLCIWYYNVVTDIPRAHEQSFCYHLLLNN